MPGGDGTGPAGMGPMTGRAAGYCTRGRGVGFGRGGFGGGRGRRHRFWATGVPGWARAGAPYDAAPTREQELEMLKGQAEYFENAMGELKKRITELNAEK